MRAWAPITVSGPWTEGLAAGAGPANRSGFLESAFDVGKVWEAATPDTVLQSGDLILVAGPPPSGATSRLYHTIDGRYGQNCDHCPLKL